MGEVIDFVICKRRDISISINLLFPSGAFSTTMQLLHYYYYYYYIKRRGLCATAIAVFNWLPRAATFFSLHSPFSVRAVIIPF